MARAIRRFQLQTVLRQSDQLTIGAAGVQPPEAFTELAT